MGSTQMDADVNWVSEMNKIKNKQRWEFRVQSYTLCEA